MMNMKDIFGTDMETMIKVIQKYQTNRKFCEEVDFLENLGQQEYIEKALRTNGRRGIND